MTHDKQDTIEIHITDDEFLYIAKRAHDLDITFNKMVERLLEAALEETTREQQRPEDSA